MSSQQGNDQSGRAARDELDERLEAVERALTDGDHDLAALTDAAEDAATVAQLRDRVDALEARLSELDAATQALRGYVGNVRSVDRDIERRADAALAKIERLEAELADERVEEREASVSDSAQARTDRHEAGTAEDAATGERDRRTASARAIESESAPDPCHCEHCGARQPDRARRTASDRPERAADTSDGAVSRGRRGDTGRPAADGGTDAWARATAREGREADESEGGFLASLRDAL